MSTARDLIRRTFMLIGVLAEGETPSADQLQDGLSSINDMLDSWSTENLNIYKKDIEEFALVGGTGSYTIGLTGTFNTAKPLKIEKATVKDGTTELELEILTFEEYASISDKTMTSTIPTKLFLDPTHPLATIKLWPVPSESRTLVLYSQKALTNLTANTVIDLPKGYSKAIRYNLAIELCPEYGKTATAEIIAGATESKGNIKRMNMQPLLMGIDSAITQGRRFNILTGE